jgi:hypothetical protein
LEVALSDKQIGFHLDTELDGYPREVLAFSEKRWAAEHVEECIPEGFQGGCTIVPVNKAELAILAATWGSIFYLFDYSNSETVVIAPVQIPSDLAAN